MLERYNIRTDLALEEKERFEEDNVEVSGVVIEEEYDRENEIKLTKVKIETENGAKSMGKPVGVYLTLEAPNMGVKDDAYHEEISKKLAEYLNDMIHNTVYSEEMLSVLVVGLGNRCVTPDALGPSVVDNLCVTRHFIKEYGRYALKEEETKYFSAIAPGVMGQTGMETAEIVHGIVRETSPDLIIAIDALAARNSRRLNRTIQVSDAGIHPGSGVGNHRFSLTKESMGIPVIGVGVPTVVDAATIVNDAIENLMHKIKKSETEKEVGAVINVYKRECKYELINDLISPYLNGMYVTLKEEDELIKQMSFTISEALNKLLEK